MACDALTTRFSTHTSPRSKLRAALGEVYFINGYFERSVDLVGWIKQRGSTMANIVRRWFCALADPILVAAYGSMPRLIHPTFFILIATQQPRVYNFAI